MHTNDNPVVVSWGGGVQSKALALMVLNEDVRIAHYPRPALWLFADTGHEPRKISAQVERFGNMLMDAGMAFEVVGRDEKLMDHVLSRAEAGEGGISMPPVYVDRRKRGGRMPVWRGCTRDFKANLLDRRGKAWLAERGHKQAVKWYGISYDEIQRMRTPDRAWYTNAYPLIDAKMRRTDCIGILRDAGVDPVRSACTFCPFHSNEEWRAIRDDPQDWAEVVAFERRLRAAYEARGTVAGLESIPSLHESGLPIDQAPIDTSQEGFGWGNECAGICGV